MKTDEYKLLTENIIPSNHKRYKFILNKWHKKGWMKNYEFTSEFYRIKDLAVNKKDYIDKYENRVVIVHPIADDWLDHPEIGIYYFNGDGEMDFTTARLFWRLYKQYPYTDIAYIELHPNPKTIFRHMNYYYWKKTKTPDAFHYKIGVLDYLTKDGVNPYGKTGECYPSCQCKYL